MQYKNHPVIHRKAKKLPSLEFYETKTKNEVELWLVHQTVVLRKYNIIQSNKLFLNNLL